VRPTAAELLRHGSQEFLSLALVLVVGCAIAALVQSLVPRQWFLAVGFWP
jgi:uncharacterized membrane protein YraQ (UPF0718 family)